MPFFDTAIQFLGYEAPRECERLARMSLPQPERIP